MNKFLMLTFYRSQFLGDIVMNPEFIPKWYEHLFLIVCFLTFGIGILIYGIYKAFYKIPKKKKALRIIVFILTMIISVWYIAFGVLWFKWYGVF